MKHYTSEPYMNLLIAIIKRAIDDCIIKRERLRHGKDWIGYTENDPEYYLFESKEEGFPSFLAVCTVFNCAPSYLRDLIKGYLEDRRIEVGRSSVDMLREKIKGKKVVDRKELSLWGWGKLRIGKEGLDELMGILKENKEIREFTSYLESNREVRCYEWIG